MPPLQEVSRGFQSVRLAELHTAVQSSSLGSGFEGHAFRCIRGYGAFMQGRWPVELVGVQAGQFRPWPVSYEASITSGQLQSGYFGWCAAQASTRKNHSSFSVPSGTVPTFHPPLATVAHLRTASVPGLSLLYLRLGNTIADISNQGFGCHSLAPFIWASIF